MPRRPVPADGLDKTIRRFDDHSARLDTLERPDGNQLNRSLQKVQQLLTDLPGLITSALSAGFTAASATITGALSVGTTATVGGNVNASGDLHGVNVYATAAPTYNITGGRSAAWWELATGRGGTATSSQRYKTALRAADVPERAKSILQVTVGYFEYLAEIAKRDDPSSPEFIGPDYHVSTNLGAIAEQLHGLGLWEWVLYERDPVTKTMTDEDGREVEMIVGDSLRLDEVGEPIPFAIHDSLIGWADLIVSQWQERRLIEVIAWAKAQGFNPAEE